MNDNKTTIINNIVPHKAAERRTRLLLPVNQKVKFNLGPEHIERAQTLAALYVRLLVVRRHGEQRFNVLLPVYRDKLLHTRTAEVFKPVVGRVVLFVLIRLFV